MLCKCSYFFYLKLFVYFQPFINKQPTLLLGRMHHMKFGFDWPSGFRYDMQSYDHGVCMTKHGYAISATYKPIDQIS